MNTRAYVKMMERYDIKLITHPGDKMPIDIDAVAKAAAEHGVLLEINPRHNHLSVEEIKIAMKYNGNFAINSDAHCSDALGCIGKAPEIIKAAGLPLDRIVNITDK